MAPTYEIDNFQFFNADNMEIMAQYPDKYFDLAIVDPPYGIGINGQVGGKKCAKVKQYKNKGWDNCIPKPEYFKELFRISQNQIIWGGNYFIDYLKNTSCFLIWNKDNTGNFADAELAWTSFDTSVRIFKYRWNGMLQQNMKDKEIRIHETQKPIALYEWILSKYAKPNDKIIDTHLGSNSIGIAIDKANQLDKKNLSFVGIELDEDYFNAGIERFKNYKRQFNLF